MRRTPQTRQHQSQSRRGVIRLAVWVLLLVSGIGGMVHSQAPEPSAPPVYVVEVDSVINPGSASLLEHAITVAEEGRAAALIVRINTPGGLLSSTRDMVNAIAESQVPVIGYVGPTGASATSAGAFILLSSHIAVMNKGTNVGASSPVAGDGSDVGGTMGKKVMNDTRAFMRGIANSRNRNADVAERFVSEAESLTASEALEQGVIDMVVPEFSALLSALDGRSVDVHGQAVLLNVAKSEIREVTPRLLDRLLQLIAHPQIAHLLISLGMLGIYVEIMSPGLAFPGVLGTIAVILGLIGAHTLPVNVGFLMLVFLGLILMGAEYFVAGFDVLGIGGALAFILGSFYLFDLPQSDEYRNSMVSVSIAVSGTVLVTTFLLSRALARDANRSNTVKGKTGEAMVSFDKAGFVLVDEQRWSADTLEPLQHGDKIEVVQCDENNRLLVRKANSASTTG
jgi:membrane-bound serine protease (ClpP class)